VWRQLLRRFATAEVAFEPLNPCAHLPLTLREFRVAAAFLELSLSERHAAMLLDSVMDHNEGEPTLLGLQSLVAWHGPKGSGDFHAHAQIASGISNTLQQLEDDMEDEVDLADRQDRRKKGGRHAAKRGTGVAGIGIPETGESSLFPNGLPPPHKPVPMVCPRCLAGEMPSFPWVSVGELHRHCAACDGDGAEPLARRQGSSANDEANLQFGEDAVVGWATSVLASGILLRKDERGAYFRWLAQTVLYAAAPRTSQHDEATQGQDDLAMQSNHQHQSKAQGGRKLSFASALAVSIPGSLETTTHVGGASDAAGEVSPGSAGGDAANHTIGGVARPDAEKRVSTRSQAKSREMEEAEQQELREIRDEVRHDQSVSLPESVLVATRVDLGLPLEEPVATSPAKRQNGDVVDPDTPTMTTKHLYRGFADRISKGGKTLGHRIKRVARGSKLLVSLRGIGVPEREIEVLHRELDAAADLPPSTNGVILVGGACRAAQTILIPNPTAKQHAMEAGAATKDTLTTHGATQAVSAAKVLADRPSAEEIVDISSTNASRCYNKAGYEVTSRRHRTAVALRLLEHELFSDGSEGDFAGVGSASAEGTEGGAAGFVDERTAVLVPLLLPDKTARRILAEVRRAEEAVEEEAKAEAAAGLDSKRGDRRKDASVLRLSEMPASGTMVRVTSVGSFKSDGESVYSDHDSGQKSPSPHSPKSRRDGTPASSMSPSSRSPGPAPVAPPMSGGGASLDEGHAAAVGADGNMAPPSAIDGQGAPSTSSPTSAAVVAVATAMTGEVDMDWAEDCATWPPSVLSLFGEIETHGRNLRSTTQGKGFRIAGGRARRSQWSGLSRSQSYSSGSVGLPLLASTTSASEAGLAGAHLSRSTMTSTWSTQGPGPASTWGPRAPRRHLPKDSVLTDGWRVKSSVVDAAKQERGQSGLFPRLERCELGGASELSRRCASSPLL